MRGLGTARILTASLLAAAATTAWTLCLWRDAEAVEGALPEHKHEKTEELAYILSGEGIAPVYRDGEPRDMAIRPGYVWYNPPGVWHTVRNTGDEPLVMVFATIPNVADGLLSRRAGAGRPA